MRTEIACEWCGHILRSQAVLHDRQTGLWVVRCPECGTVQPARASRRPRRWLLLLVGGHTSRALGAALWLLVVALICAALYMSFFPDQWLRALAMLVLAAGVMLATCGHLYRLPGLLRVVVLLTPVLTSLAAVLGFNLRRRTPVAELLSLPAFLLAGLAMPVAWWCRPLLRAAVRVLLPNPSRYVFEDLWRVDGKLLARGPQ